MGGVGFGAAVEVLVAAEGDVGGVALAHGSLRFEGFCFIMGGPLVWGSFDVLYLILNWNFVREVLLVSDREQFLSQQNKCYILRVDRYTPRF